MPSIIHFLNDFGIVPTVFLSVLFLALFTFLLKRKDKSSLLLLGTIVVLSITSSNPITPANPGFYITVASLFTILNKYIRPVTTFNQRQQIFRFNS